MNYVQFSVILLKNRVWQSIIQSKFYIMVKQERNFAKEKGDLIHTSSCDGRRSEGLYMVQCIEGVQLLKKLHLFNLKFTAF